MKNLKKVLALVLAFAMAFTMMATAGAAYTDQADIEATEAVEMLNALGIMTGDPDGSFRPNDTITRAEAARMIYSIRTGTDNADAYADMQTTFKDVSADSWYAGYVKHCQAAGIVSGTSATTFEPSRDVTGVELALMCLRVMGYDPAKADIGGSTWSTRTISLATEAGLLDDVNVSSITSACPRQWAAQIMYNTIQANTVRWSDDAGKYNNTNYAGEEYETVGEKYLKLYTIVGTLTEVNTKNMTISQTDSDEQDTDKAVRGITSFSELDKDYSALLGQKVKVLIYDKKSNNVIGVYATEDNKTYSVNASLVEKDDNKVKIDGSSYSVEYFGDNDSTKVSEKANGDAITTYINGEIAKGTTLDELDNNGLNPNKYTFVDSDNNGKLDTLYVVTYNVAKVTYASSDKIIAGGKTYKTADENIDENIAKDDWVVITENLYEDCKDIVKADMSTGTVNGLRTEKNKTVYFDGADKLKTTDYNEYRIGDQWYKGAELLQSTSSESDLKSVKAGNEVEYVVVNDILFYVKRVSGNSNGKISDVAVIVNKGTTGINDEVKIALFDGSTKTVTVDNDSDKKNGEVPFADLEVGVAYEYDVSGNEYTFSGLVDDEEYYGDLTYIKGQTASNSNKLTKVGSYNIDDNAEVILFKGKQGAKTGTDVTGNDTKKISGKQLKAMSETNIVNSKNLYAFYGDMSGIDRVGAVVVNVTSVDDIANTWSSYGYIVTKPYKVDNRTIEYTFWNGSENVTVREDKSNINDRDKGTVIGYDTLNTDGDYKVIDDVDALTDKHIALTAVTSVNDKGTTAIFAYNAIPGANGSTELDVVSDSDVFYVDTNADDDLDIGQADGEIKEAQKNNGKYLANALVIGNDDEIELLIIDQGEYLDTLDASYKEKGTDVIYGEDVKDDNGDKGDETTAEGIELFGVTGNTTKEYGAAAETLTVDATLTGLKNETPTVEVYKNGTKVTENVTVSVAKATSGGTANISASGVLKTNEAVNVNIDVKMGESLAAGEYTLKVVCGKNNAKAIENFTFTVTKKDFTPTYSSATANTIVLTGFTGISDDDAEAMIKEVKGVVDTKAVALTMTGVTVSGDSATITFSEAIETGEVSVTLVDGENYHPTNYEVTGSATIV